MNASAAGGPRGDYTALYREVQRLRAEVDRLSTLREIGFATNSSLELHEVLPVIATVVQGALEVGRLTVYARQGVLLQPLIARFGEDMISAERLAEEAVPVSRPPYSQALEGRAVLFTGAGAQQMALVPLLAGYEPIGILRIEQRRDGGEFGASESDFLMQVGAHIAVALNNARLYAMAVTDGLTGLFVRRYFDLRLGEEFEQARRYGRIFSVIIADIDHFKSFNDTHGHQTGDVVLKQVADLLRANTRRSDVCCRYGGEEMAIVLPETGLRAARQLAEKLCVTLRDTWLLGAEGQQLSVTASFGVAVYDPCHAVPEALVAAADQALYAAKKAGRDRVEAAPVDVDPG